MKKHFGWTVYGILGYIFAPMGALFAAIGLFVGQSLNARWQSPEDPVIFRAIFCSVGGIFLLLGLVFLFVDLRRRYLLGRAYNCGNCVDAQVLGMVTQKNVSTFQGQPRMLEAAWTDGSGVVHVYRSRYLYTDVTRLLKSDTVPVYVDRFDENIGFVDIDAVLPEIRVH
ncbi:MAG: hypothetical protein IJI09_11385 [Clostridia bacterium]|nr:hypothetical protein [Clostridia bacterium]